PLAGLSFDDRGLQLLDVVDDVLNRRRSNGRGPILRNADVELLLDLEQHFDQVERVELETLQRGLGSDELRRNGKLRGEDLLNFFKCGWHDGFVPLESCAPGKTRPLVRRRRSCACRA